MFINSNNTGKLPATAINNTAKPEEIEACDPAPESFVVSSSGDRAESAVSHSANLEPSDSLQRELCDSPGDRSLLDPVFAVKLEPVEQEPCDCPAGSPPDNATMPILSVKLEPLEHVEEVGLPWEPSISELTTPVEAHFVKVELFEPLEEVSSSGHQLLSLKTHPIDSEIIRNRISVGHCVAENHQTDAQQEVYEHFINTPPWFKLNPTADNPTLNTLTRESVKLEQSNVLLQSSVVFSADPEDIQPIPLATQHNVKLSPMQNVDRPDFVDVADSLHSASYAQVQDDSDPLLTNQGPVKTRAKFKRKTSGKHKHSKNRKGHSRTNKLKKPKPFVCETCNMGFVHQSNLTRHALIHTGLKPFACTYCEKAFNHPGSLRDHIRTHVADKRFICETCNAGFIQKSNLMRHMVIHDGTRPFQCPQCERAFKHSSSLKKHSFTHIPTAVKSCLCTICGKGFLHKSLLQSHMRVHNHPEMYRCTTCGRGFKSQSYLRKHALTHMVVKSFVCAVCSKGCAHKSSLIRHMLSHKSKLNCCTTCGRAFARMDHLKSHMLTHSFPLPKSMQRPLPKARPEHRYTQVVTNSQLLPKIKIIKHSDYLLSDSHTSTFPVLEVTGISDHTNTHSQHS